MNVQEKVDGSHPGTYFAPAARATVEELHQQVQAVSNNSIIDAVMRAFGGLLAVLNEQRQVVAVNDALLHALKITNPQELLGLRPGEVLKCSHAHDEPGGCGTSKACASCGAVIAIMGCQKTDKPVDRECVITSQRNSIEVDMRLRVRASPVEFHGKRFTLFFLQDITPSQCWAELERVFFHDISNIIGGLYGATELLKMEDGGNDPEIAGMIHTLAQRLRTEVDLQRSLSLMDPGTFQIKRERTTVAELLDELRRTYSSHPSALGKHLAVTRMIPDVVLVTDFSLVVRVLGNMVLNAMEATPEGGDVKLWAERLQNTVTFCVWNQQVIPDSIAPRIFQRHFSTKDGSGRGLGTYSMKMFGEKYLGGKVSFTTSPTEGTVFRLALPA